MSPSNSRVDKVLKPLQEFLRLEAAGGLILMAAAVVALVIANSPLASYYRALLDLPFEVRLGTFSLAKPILLWVNDGLMAVFFFLVGMELKREVVEGHLSSLQRASLPAFAAVGGMVVPAAFIAFACCSGLKREVLFSPSVIKTTAVAAVGRASSAKWVRAFSRAP